MSNDGTRASADRRLSEVIAAYLHADAGGAVPCGVAGAHPELTKPQVALFADHNRMRRAAPPRGEAATLAWRYGRHPLSFFRTQTGAGRQRTASATGCRCTG